MHLYNQEQEQTKRLGMKLLFIKIKERTNPVKVNSPSKKVTRQENNLSKC